jgi:hypothetical protein
MKCIGEDILNCRSTAVQSIKAKIFSIVKRQLQDSIIIRKGYVHKFVTYIDDIDIQSALEIMITTKPIAILKNAVSIFDLRY